MIRFPAAKINIGLAITERRSDGYHTIESVFYPVPFYDALEAVPADHGACNLSVSGLPIAGDQTNNLVVRAWEVLHRAHQIPGVDAALLKRIPMGAGLGGGSSDGAHMLLLLNDLFDLQLSTAQLEVYAAALGSDCPFFIRQKPAFVTGRGEVLESLELDLSGWWLMLIHPGIHVGTKEAYGLISPCRADADLRDAVQLNPAEWKMHIKNDFQVPVIERFPEIQEAIGALEAAGAVYTAMSGSGSAVYGLFLEAPTAPQTPSHWSVFRCDLSA